MELIAGQHGRLPQATQQDFDGNYYVLRFDLARSRLVLQHDTHHEGLMGPHWERTTFTEIQLRGSASPIPHVGWLRDHLLELLGRFGPNHFSVTWSCPTEGPGRCSLFYGESAKSL